VSESIQNMRKRKHPKASESIRKHPGRIQGASATHPGRHPASISKASSGHPPPFQKASGAGPYLSDSLIPYIQDFLQARRTFGRWWEEGRLAFLVPHWYRTKQGSNKDYLLLPWSKAPVGDRVRECLSYGCITHLGSVCNRSSHKLHR
jgi:hypothetical protein